MLYLAILGLTLNLYLDPILERRSLKKCSKRRLLTQWAISCVPVNLLFSGTCMLPLLQLGVHDSQSSECYPKCFYAIASPAPTPVTF